MKNLSQMQHQNNNPKPEFFYWEESWNIELPKNEDNELD